MTRVRRSSRPLLTYAAAAGAAFVGTWGITASEARWGVPASAAATPTVRAPAIVVRADEPPPSPDSLAALLIDPSRPGRASRGQAAMLRDAVAMTEQIWSTSERALVLRELAAFPGLDSSIVAAIAHATTRIPSPSQRGDVLRLLIERQPPAVGVSRRAVLDAIGSMASSSARAGTLQAFVSRPRLTQPALVDALAHAGRLPSNDDRSSVLIAAARTHRIEGRARTVYLQAASALSSSRQRSRVLSAIGARSHAHGGH